MTKEPRTESIATMRECRRRKGHLVYLVKWKEQESEVE